METLIHTFKGSLQITLFVLAMMLIIEYFTVSTKNKLLTAISKNTYFQVFIASLLGILPGCLGTFLVVSLYVHNAMNLSSLVSVMIATSGDEAFVMFSTNPALALKLNAVLFVFAILTGFVLNLFLKDKTFYRPKINHLTYHNDNIECVCFDKSLFVSQLRKMTFERFLLILGSFLFLFAILTGELGPQKWNYIKFTLVGIGIFLLFISITVPDHFVQEHLWQHTIKKHLLKIFLWTFGTLFFIDIIMPYLGLSEEKLSAISQNYYWIVLLIAVLVGIIPESGPHLIFWFLFLKGAVPFSIILANSVVQDGHGSLPLLAETRKNFFLVKGLNIIVGFVAGVIFHLFFDGWFQV